MRQLKSIAIAWSLLLVLSFAANSQTPQDLSKIAENRSCPAQLTTYELVNANDTCNPENREVRSCDSRFEQGTRQWSECYEDILICRRQVDDSNTKIIQYNSLIYKCRDEQRQKETKEKLAAVEAARLAKPDKQGQDQSASSPLSRALQEQRRKAEEAAKKSESDKNAMPDIANNLAARNRLEKDRIDAADLSGWKQYQNDLERQREEQRRKYMEELRQWREAQRQQAERNMAIMQQQRQEYDMLLSTLTSAMASRGNSYTPSRITTSPPPRKVFGPARPACQQVAGGGSCGVQ